MDIKDIKAVYFVGAGGIGMSAIARYFIRKGLVVAGYDKTPSDLTRQLEKEGMLIHYEENTDEIPQACRNAQRAAILPRGRLHHRKASSGTRHPHTHTQRIVLCWNTR